MSTKTILDLSHTKAKEFFLKQDSYCNFELPQYFQFTELLNKIDYKFQSFLSNYWSKRPNNYDVNHIIFYNKDSRYAWRPLELIHPVLYVDLVNIITKKDNWEYIITKFKEFREDNKIKCLSLPVVAMNKKKNKAEQILKWWKEVEQESIKLSLDYDYIFHTDITDCYSSIYTHSIAWALHEKKIAKKKRHDDSLIGNIIDKQLQRMNNGQTNGIPQGSVLSDFIAEIILGYIDKLLGNALNKMGSIGDYQIIRYRDDYRIFVNSPKTGEIILKTLSEKLLELNFKLNPEKTVIIDDVIIGSIKKDKLFLIKIKENFQNLQQELLEIYKFSKLYPNSGSLIKLLVHFYDKINRTMNNSKPLTDVYVLIAIVIQIMFEDPKVIPVGVGIISILFSELEDNDKIKLIRKIKKSLIKCPISVF